MEVYPHLVHIEISDFEVIVGAETQRHLLDLRGNQVQFEPGTLTCILGPSGCGKTTLLKTICNQLESRSNSPVRCFGSLCINGESLNSFQHKLPGVLGFVQQDQVLLSCETLAETMEFASHLRIGTVVESHLRPHPGSIQLGDNGDVNVAEDDDSDSDESADRVAVSFPKENQTQLQTRVSSIASILGISKLLDRSVGQMSGGEKKRVSIGVEMLINRPLVVIDEGTTGLDSFQALLLIRALRRQATYDLSTVIITLHQPSYEMFHMCDQLLLFGPDGRLAFTGSPRNLTMFLSKLGHACAEFENPVDFAVELMSVLSKSELDDMVAFNQQIQGLENLDTVEYVKRQDEPHVAIDAAQAMSDFLQVDVTSPSEQDASIPPPFIRRRTKQFASSAEIATTIYYDAGIVTEMGALSRRSCRRCIRSPMMFRVRLLSTLFVAILLGLIFPQLGNDQTSIQNRNGSIFLILNQCVYGTIGPLALTFSEERDVFLREKACRTYSTGSYFFSRTLIEIVYVTPFSILLVLIVYWWIGYQNTASAFFSFLLTAISVSWAALAIGLLIAASSSTPIRASVITVFIIIPLYLLGGLFTVQVPVFLDWLKYISPYYYGFSNFAIAEYSGLVLYCTPDQLLPTGACPFTSGEQVLQMLHINPAWLVPNWALLWALFVVVDLLAYGVLLYVGRPNHITLEAKRFQP